MSKPEAVTGLKQYLRPTFFIDSDSPEVVDYARAATAGAACESERAVALYFKVRDGMHYSPYCFTPDRDSYRASRLTRAQRGFCIQKAILLAAAARAVGIPSRLHFADVRNHLSSEKLIASMGTDLFVYHGYTGLLVDGVWLKATPTFNIELCEKLGVAPLDFDGCHDAIFHPYDKSNRRHMEYVRDRGHSPDLPFEEMVREITNTYAQSALLKDREVSDPVFD